jgi:hypothetical protein
MNDDEAVTQSTASDDPPAPLVGFVVSVEQLALLRDLLSAHPITVVIDDCRNSELLDDQWKPWARRVRTQLKNVSGPIIVRAPSYSFPDPQHHPKIRDTIAIQLQAVCDLAVVVGAQKIIIPIEAGIPALYLKDFNELYGTDTWRWKDYVEIDGVYYYHGEGCGGQHPAFVVDIVAQAGASGAGHPRLAIKRLVQMDMRFDKGGHQETPAAVNIRGAGQRWPDFGDLAAYTAN